MDVGEVSGMPSPGLDEPSVVRRKDIPLHALDEIEPMGDDAHFVLFDKTN